LAHQEAVDEILTVLALVEDGLEFVQQPRTHIVEDAPHEVDFFGGWFRLRRRFAVATRLRVVRDLLSATPTFHRSASREKGHVPVA
jgi:hypothetical protein